ncbi:LexA family transcriptional regulator [Clostridiales bacterium PH28_bin88]|nr:LexA family transcriptional regulator [Clostridiales bacterium PH28_bin88]
MHDDLNTRQQAILDFIKRELRVKGYPPSVREIGEAVGLSSSSTVHGHLAQLESKGYLRRDPAKPRAIEVLSGNIDVIAKELVPVPIVGRITAGEPILATENIDDTFPLPFDFLRTRDVFILSVKGDSMIQAGIMDGDFVVVRQQSFAKDGDIVVALLGEEATVKRFFKEAEHIRLQPENPDMQPIFSREVQILGKVIGVFRRVY